MNAIRLSLWNCFITETRNRKRSNTLDLLSSYLHARKHVIENGQGTSKPALIKSGVRQGSILGLLFHCLFFFVFFCCCFFFAGGGGGGSQMMLCFILMKKADRK